ncbi:ABC transporter substrate-binding protein [Siccirubricoccus sp. KC 17139]|uniref:ABC transporter substrate-binding protein n=1 Tax=Siccirubricoccus soli TaxID=2899147 RepID=A0ABT1D725_9PROT|nr:ABC transporter substrate-binding protein [Siccirubricoccus soli]MCO6417055.1 ABC transporter substrate-binding protein [Siccirubricoccus soli]MCP2683190.1 ABC transporter substrate-binding protein [Siccirubricoccus soli]
MRKLAYAALLALAAGTAHAQPAPRNTLVVLREIDADNYDPPRSTARSAGESLYMMSDTLVSLDWDMKTVRPGLAERWDVSEDGRLYTFHLRRDVTFCDGKPFTARDVVYTINRWLDPATRSPVRWRAGPVKEVRAKDDYTVEYELTEPYGELLYQLSLFFASIVDQATVEKLGQNFGVQGFNGTGPYCWVSWTPRQELVLQRHPNYRWGPPIYRNPSPQVERVIWRVVPESQTRLAALQTGQADATQYIPNVAINQLRNVPTVRMSTQENYFWDYFLGFKVDKPVVSDPAIRRAINQAVNRSAIVQAVWFGTAQPATSYLNPNTAGYDAEAAKLVPGYDPEAARRTLDEAGWRMGPDNVRVKGGQRASFLTYAINTQTSRQYLEAIQADLRRIGIEMRIQLWDATVGWGKLATQEFDAFTMSYPYVTATDAFSLYFDSRNRPTPNRMNWNDPATDEALTQAKVALDPAARAAAIAQAQRIVAENNVWLPLAREQIWVAASQRTEGVRAHGIYGVALYKGLDIRLTR